MSTTMEGLATKTMRFRMHREFAQRMGYGKDVVLFNISPVGDGDPDRPFVTGSGAHQLLEGLAKELKGDRLIVNELLAARTGREILLARRKFLLQHWRKESPQLLGVLNGLDVLALLMGAADCRTTHVSGIHESNDPIGTIAGRPVLYESDDEIIYGEPVGADVGGGT